MSDYIERMADYPDVRVLSRRTVKATKVYKCMACGREIGIGSTYSRTVFLVDGKEIETQRVHIGDPDCPEPRQAALGAKS